MGRAGAGSSSLRSAVVVVAVGWGGFEIGEGAADEAARGGGIVAGDGDQSAEAEVGDVGAEFVVEEDVGGLDVAMDELSWAALVEIGQPPCSSLGNS